MYLGNNLVPAGCNKISNNGRTPIVRVIAGDTCIIKTELIASDGSPATPNNSFIEFVLSENQFSPAIWTGNWNTGITQYTNRPGFVRIAIPRDLTKTLRHGSYQFSLRVADKMKSSYITQLSGNLLVEYRPTSEQHSIPYRDGTSDIASSTGGSCGEGAVSITENQLVPLAGTEDNGKVLMAEDGTPKWKVQGSQQDYSVLQNKPSINGVVLTGNKTSDQLGLASAVFYPSDDGFMFVPAGKVEIEGVQTQVYRKQSFVTDPDMGVVLSISDHRYVHNTTTGGFDDIDE